MPVDRPLSGVRVVDAVHGPLAMTTRYLAELGARVDRIVGEVRLDPMVERVVSLGKTVHTFDHHASDAAPLLAAADIIVEDCGLDRPGAIRRRSSSASVLSDEGTRCPTGK